MTDAHEPNEIDGPHEGPIKTPKQLIMAVVGAFVIPIALIVLLVMYVTTDHRPAAGSDAKQAESIAARIMPVGHVEIKDATDLASMKTGEQVFAAQCTACHTAGALGAPKFGDVAAWAPRIKTGFDALWHSALAGKGSMSAQGGGDYSDYEIARAVVYMANKAGASFPEPAAPAAPEAASASAVAAPSGTAGSGEATAPGTVNANTDRPAAADAAPLKAVAPMTSAAPAPAPAPAPPVVVAAANTTATAPAPALYGQVCSACHAAGLIGAPKLGSKADWAPRTAKGIDALVASAIAGKGAMPPRGGSNASDADIRAVVTYMVNASK